MKGKNKMIVGNGTDRIEIERVVKACEIRSLFATRFFVERTEIDKGKNMQVHL